ncbi:L-xylulose reductase-like [Cydia amplana]|uniref:L-xylulose reductase-like n=1 Tax=Cydia amplana TaxID=1869771 RepID=UPI002FE527B6
MDTFKGKRILVTGGSQGIGKGIVIELWRLGANVVTISNQPDELHTLKSEYPTIETAYVDLCDWVATRKAVESLGVFDGLVNNAGVAIIEPFLECTPTSFDRTMSINVRAILNVSQVVAQKMIQHKIKGSIVNISSKASMAALPNHVAYCASKSAVDSMTRVMSLELGQHGIRVNTVNPTAVMSELGRRVWADPVKAGNLLAKIPLGRFGEVEEVVNTVLFLLSSRATMITGVQLPVDGGFLAT